MNSKKWRHYQKVHANCKICYHPRVFTDFRNQKICFPCFKKKANADTSRAENNILAEESNLSA
jgi:ribosomal protein S14